MEDKKNKGIGILLTLLFHGVLVVILIFCGFPKIEPREEEGILVMVGLEPEGETGSPAPEPVAQETSQPKTSTEPVSPSVETKEPVITQEDEESLAMQKAKEQERKRQEQLRREEEEKRRKAEEEKKRLAEQKRREEAINNRVANVFQSASKNSGKGSSQGDGAKGNPFGNSSSGATSGTPGYGSYDLGGRGIRGVLPRPSFSVNESGKVVVSVTVNADGKVIRASIGRGTTTSSVQLRNSALAAAKKAVFEVKTGASDQIGTITYLFDSDN